MWEQVDVGNGVKKYPWAGEDPADCNRDVRGLGEGLVPGRGGLWSSFPRCTREALDRLDCNASGGSYLGKHFEVLCIAWVPLLANVVWKQHRVEREALQASSMHRRDRDAVTRHADDRDQALGASLDRRLQSASRTEGVFPFDYIDQVVQLNQIDSIDAEPVKRSANLLLSACVVSFSRLGCEEEMIGLAREPRR